jgi:hypothetical protein
MDKPPLLLLRLATRYRAPLALTILFSKCVLKNSFGLSQKLSYLVAPCLIVNVYPPMRMTASFAARRTLRRLLNTRTSVLLTSNLTLLSDPYRIASPAMRLSCPAPSPSSLHSTTSPMSSTNEIACSIGCLSSSYWNMALTDRMNSTGNTGDPCGRPA